MLHRGAARSVTAGTLCQLKVACKSELSCSLAGIAVQGLLPVGLHGKHKLFSQVCNLQTTSPRYKDAVTFRACPYCFFPGFDVIYAFIKSACPASTATYIFAAELLTASRAAADPYWR